MSGLLTLALTSALGFSLIGASSARSVRDDLPAMPPECRSSYLTATRWNTDVSRVASDRIVTMDGHVVRLRGTEWRADDPRDGAWTLWFHSLAWLVPLALDDSETAIRVFEERDRALPDPGPYLSRDELRPRGWTQGQFRTRLLTATCLYLMTGDERLRPIAERLAEANMDERRYPGPPLKEVHNHGAMSNAALQRAGKAFGMPSWIALARERFERDMPRVFDSCGMMAEQASGYQLHNVSLYESLAEDLGKPLAMPMRALGALVRPDGVLEAIGDGVPTSGLTPNGESLWCPQSGWAAGTDEGMHFTLRFGPRMRLHGHRDHGGMTWFTRGVPVLSDRGLYDKHRDSRYVFAHSMAAHSVFEPVGHESHNPDSKGLRLSSTAFRVRGSDAGIERERVVTFGRDRLVVRDKGSGADEWIQHFQLAPGWRPTKTGAIHESGMTLEVDCPRLKAVRVEMFTGWRQAVKAWDLQCRVESDKGQPVRLVTTLTVSPPNGA